MRKEQTEKLDFTGRPLKKKHPGDRIRLLLAVFLILLTGALMVLFSRFPDFFFPVYKTVSKAYIGALAAVSSVVPFGIWDFLSIIAVGLVILTLILVIVKRKRFLQWFSWVFLAASVLLLSLVGGWMLNHFGPTLAEEIDLPVRQYTEDELYHATAYYFDKAAEYAGSVPRDENNELVRQDFYELAKIAGENYADLSAVYPALSGSTLPVKPLLLYSNLLMYSGISGMFMPLTGEASLPLYGAVADQPFTMCHEAAHRLAIASEDGANFAAFLACVSSDDERFIYSGYYCAFIYCYNALYGKNYKRLKSMIESKLSDDADGLYALVLKDTNTQAEFYTQYDSPLQEVSEKANDTYLKAFKEESGVKSYGEVVDDLIIWQILEIQEERGE